MVRCTAFARYENKQRSSRAKAILALAEEKSPEMKERINDVTNMTTLLLALCKANIRDKIASLKTVCPSLSNGFARHHFSKIIIPTERVLSVAVNGTSPRDVFFHRVDDQVKCCHQVTFYLEGSCPKRTSTVSSTRTHAV